MNKRRNAEPTWKVAAVVTGRLLIGSALIATLLAPITAAAQTNQPPNVSPIQATEGEVVPTTTIYSVQATDPNGDPLSFVWSKTPERTCGSFESEGNQAFWDHPHPPCPEEVVHPGTISVVVSDGAFTCRAEYTGGSATGTGNDPEVCVAIEPTPSPTPTATPSPSPTGVSPPLVSVPRFNVLIDPAIKPGCGCTRERGSGISMVEEDPCPKCAAVGDYGGIVQDTGSNSVYLHSGEFFLNEVDLEIPGRGTDWRFERSYRSGVTLETALGHNWDFNYNRRLVVLDQERADALTGTFAQPGPGDVARVDGLGRADLYEVGSSGSFEAPTGFYTSLDERANGGFVERDFAGAAVVYGPPDPATGVAPMTSTTDRNGNRMRFEHDASGRLTRVIDTLGRPIEYRYSAQGKLTEVEDFAGRTITFGYDQAGDLVSVTSPTVTGTPNGNDFPQGKTVRYAYSSGPSELQRHNLLTITAPNEVAEGGPPRLSLDYDGSDRVITQTEGGTNASGVPAGGAIKYAYATLSGSSSNPNVAAHETTVTDRNGNRTEYQFNPLGNILQTRESTNRDVRPDDPAFYETRFRYSSQGELTEQVFPDGNSIEYVYDAGKPHRLSQGNLRSITRVPDERGGDQDAIVETYSYEPVYNQVRATVEPRGNEPGYVPQNGGATSAARYRTTHVFDFQEGTLFGALGRRIGLGPGEMRRLLRREDVPMGLGDLNGDGNVGQISGNVIRIERPSVHLIPSSLQAGRERTHRQTIVETFVYNRFGQLTSHTDAERNVTLHRYYPANDPDGDGADLTGAVTGPFGYRRQRVRDARRDRLRDSRTNPAPAATRTQWSYDSVGNITRIVDGRGIATEFVVNELNQVVQTTRAAGHGHLSARPREPMPLTDFAYLSRTTYDFNDNVTAEQIEDRGDTSGVGGNNTSAGTAFVDHNYRYDILDQRVTVTQEVSDNESVVTQMRYDPNGNQVLLIGPERNAVSLEFDERDLLFRRTRGATAAPSSALMRSGDPSSFDVRGGTPSATRYGYDLNGNVVEISDGADTDGSNLNDSSLGGGDRTRIVYDGFDRETSVVDAVGNQRVFQYDPADNVVRQSRFGPVGGPSPTSDGGAVVGPVSSGGTIQSSNLVGGALLRSTALRYDELSREIQRDRALFVNTIATTRQPDVADGGRAAGKRDLTPGDTCSLRGVSAPPSGYLGCVSMRTEYDRNSRPTFRIEDDRDTARIFYDGVDRVIRSVDPHGNVVQTAYDDNDNVIETRQVDSSQVRGVDDEVFLTTNFYDSLDRLQRRVNNLGHTFEYRYDSRGNEVAASDAQGPVTGARISRRAFGGGARTVDRINDSGNVTLSSYDGLDRKVVEELILTASGEGDGVNIGADLQGIKGPTPVPDPSQGGGDGIITLSWDWDANSLLASNTDDEGNQTRYTYDNLNRRTAETKGICTPGATTDVCEPATTMTYEVDPDDNVFRYTDENGSVSACSFDAIDRPVTCQIDRAPGLSGSSQLSYEYDGLSRMTRATDNNEPGPADDDSVVTFAHDSLDRTIEETQKLGDLAAKVISSGWRAENLRTSLTYPNGRTVTYEHDRLDRLNKVDEAGRRPAIALYDFIGTGRIAQRRYPANGTRLTFLNDAGTRDTGYDGLRRARRLRHVGPDGSSVVGFELTYDRMNNSISELKLHSRPNSERYGYDSAYRLTDLSRPNPGSRAPSQSEWSLDGVGNWDEVDDQTRRHSSFNEVVELDDGGLTTLTYDNNGNLLDDGTLTYQWDALNRLRTVTRKSDDAEIAAYTYDALGRRIRKIVTNSGPLDGTTHFYLDGYQEIEERTESDVVSQQYVYGQFFNEPLVLDRNRDRDGSATEPGDDRFFYHANHLGSIFALTDRGGDLVEGYLYDAYGQVAVYRPGPNQTVDFGGDDVVASSSGVGNPRLFTGGRFDPETGLYYQINRYHSPALGRFISRDPIGIWSDDVTLGNGYSYTGNRPTSLIDTTGLSGEECIWDPEHAPYPELFCMEGERQIEEGEWLGAEFEMFVEVYFEYSGTLKASAKGGVLVEVAVEVAWKNAIKAGLKKTWKFYARDITMWSYTDCYYGQIEKCREVTYFSICDIRVWTKAGNWYATGRVNARGFTRYLVRERGLQLWQTWNELTVDPHDPTKAERSSYQRLFGMIVTETFRPVRVLTR